MGTPTPRVGSLQTEGMLLLGFLLISIRYSQMLCAEEYFPRIAENFESYENFCRERKTAAESEIILTQETAKVECKGHISIQAQLPVGRCELVAVRSAKKRLKYALKIRVSHFDKRPCVRFCSRDHVHVNVEAGQGLAARSVPTPHFHRVDSRGLIFAYKTPELEDPEMSANIVADAQLGTDLFCREVNLVSLTGSPIVLKIETAELELIETDPLNGANFPE